MNEFIRVEPTPSQRRAFAGWAVAQRPKIRTLSPTEFAVPPHLFTDVPEQVLIGALVDGHRYVSPVEDAAHGRPGPGAPDLLGVATPAGLTPAPGSPEADAPAMVSATSPATVQAAMTAALVATDVATANAAHNDGPVPVGDDGPRDDAPEGVFPCPECTREFTTERGRDTHRRQAHREE
ncbi:hypothetical protein VSR01_16250 [Actinacidiphila sp. DG2A-62]|uniref:hypothetical protein n=1 Tax=Actinacidiphila sp. DG2A-62 TaxID=3108821 RepID=UPI002DBE674D|nr:hypothetical protein [Actinacidiphila sp. DG2A-62]MEC3994997.1 hypothetical protein [Actinacidiphila sp. DG2A-62]